jgi:amino acid transporter
VRARCVPPLVAQAEISSQYTVAGGPYYWAGALSGKLGRFPAYLQGAPPRTCYCAVLACVVADATITQPGSCT